MLDRIPVNLSRLPYNVNITLGQIVFRMEFNYNSTLDRFVVNLYKENELVCGGEKLVYGMPLFGDSYEVEKYPIFRIVPFDESGSVQVVNRETMGNVVFLNIEDDGELIV